MAKEHLSRNALRSLLNTAPRHATRSSSQVQRRCFGSSTQMQTTPIVAHDTRPGIRHNLRCIRVQHGRQPSCRTLFIATENTPNADALKFKPHTRVLPENFSAPFLEYMSPRATLAPPHPSPLAAQLLNVDGVSSVFYGADYITVTKESGTNWAHIKPEVFSLITESITAGKEIVSTVKTKAGEEDGQGGAGVDSLEQNEGDSEVVQMIKELLDTRIRPAIQEDGGDIEFRGFTDGWVMLKLRGACRTCDSSTVTLRNGIESMLMHYIEEVKGVQQVMDQEEQVAMEEFARFEEKLRQQKGAQAVASSGGKGTLDSAET